MIAIKLTGAKQVIYRTEEYTIVSDTMVIWQNIIIIISSGNVCNPYINPALLKPITKLRYAQKQNFRNASNERFRSHKYLKVRPDTFRLNL